MAKARTAEAVPLPETSVKPDLLARKSDQAEFFRNMKRLVHRGLPSDLAVLGPWPLADKQVDAECVSFRGCTLVDSRHWYAHSGVPHVFRPIDMGCCCEAGVPLPTVF